MEIVFKHTPFVQPVTDLLRELDRIRFFSHGLLIGSWPMTIYADHFTLVYALATDDIDFAVENAVGQSEGLLHGGGIIHTINYKD